MTNESKLAAAPQPVAPGAVDAQAGPGDAAYPHEEMDAAALARYKVVPTPAMFCSHAVVAGDGAQRLYLGRQVECENMARKFSGAFLDGAFAFNERLRATPPSVSGIGEAAEPALPTFRTGDADLDNLLTETAYMAEGPTSMDTGIMWMAALEKIIARLSTPATPPLEAQPDAKDAERYRWLRENSHPLGGSIEVLEEPENDGPCNHLYGTYLDGAIDAALQATKEGGK